MRASLKSAIVVAILITVALQNIQQPQALSETNYSWDEKTKTATIYKNPSQKDWINITSLDVSFGVAEFRETIAVTSTYKYNFTEAMDFGLEIEKHKGKNNILSKDYYLHSNVSYNVTVPIYSINSTNRSREVFNDITSLNDTEWYWDNQSYISGYYNRTQYRDELSLYTLNNKKIDAGETLIFDVVVKAEAKIGEFSRLIQPVFGGIKIKELTWWNNTKLNMFNMVKPDGAVPYVFQYNLSNATCSNNQTHICGNGKFNKGFSGINMTDSNTTEEPYTILQKFDGTGEAWLYVNWTINGSKQIYFNEGNLGTEVGNASNGNSTFPFFDDFNGANLDTSKWSTGTATLSGGIATFTSGTAIAKSISTFGVNFATKANISMASTALALYGFADLGSGRGYQVFYTHNPTSNVHNMMSHDGSAYTSNSAGALSGYKVLEILRDGTTRVLFLVDSSPKTPITTNIDADAFPVGIRPQAQDVLIDWVFVRRYISPEPASGTWGAEVGENVAPTISNVTSQTVNENNTVYVDIDGSDANGDPLTFSTNRSDLFTDFNTTTGKGNWTTNFTSAGTHYVDFGISDGINSTNATMTLTLTNIPLSITAFQPSSDPSVAKNTAQAFNITTNRSANVTWLVNGTQAHVNTSVTIANYTNNGSTAGYHNITVSTTDGVDIVSRMWNLTITAPATSSTSGGGSSVSSTIISGTETKEAWSNGRKDFLFAVIFEGIDGRVEFPDTSEHGIIALNMFFKTPTKGTYTFILSTYTDYNPRLNGSRKYFSISPNFDLKPTSSIELTSEETIELYQLYGETWKKLPKGAKVSKAKCRFPVASFGVFAVMPVAKQEVKANIIQPKESIFDFNFNISQVFKNLEKKDTETYEMLKVRFDSIRGLSLSEAIENIKTKDTAAYELLKVKLTWLVGVVDELKALIAEKLSNLL